MQFGNATIITPADNPVQYDPDWRSTFAAAMIDYPAARLDHEYLVYKKDEYIRKHAEYIRASREGRVLSKEQKHYRLASTWFQGNRPSDAKFKIEPLLLTPVGFDIISLDIGGGVVDPEVFKVYERLYFNVRLDGGKMHPSCQLRTFFATPDGPPGPLTPVETVWKAVGANLGYDALASMWLWSDAHGITNKGPEYLLQELWRVAQATVMSDIYSRRVDHLNLSMLMGRITDHERMRRELAGASTEGTDTLKVMLGILAMTKPDLISAAKDTDEEVVLTQAIRSRLAAQKQIDTQGLADRGSELGAEAVNELIGGHFKKEKE